jgi:hypothetical protein
MVEIPAESVHSGFSGGPEPHINEALTDMHTYTLMLERDWEGLGRRLEELAAAGGSSEQFAQLVARRAEIEEELEALRMTTAALRKDTVDDPLDVLSAPAGRGKPRVPAA